MFFFPEVIPQWIFLQKKFQATNLKLILVFFVDLL